MSEWYDDHDWVEDEFISELKYLEWLISYAPLKAQYEYRECPNCKREVQLCFYWNIVDNEFQCEDPTCPYCDTWLIPPKEYDDE